MAYGNITVQPLSFARSVAKPEIKEVLDLDTGEFVSANELITGLLYQDLIIARGLVRERMNTDRPRYRCAMCGVQVYLVSTSEKRFFFRHRVEDGSCPAQTRSQLTYEEICARKYHGLKESEPHRRIKGLIEQSLLADPEFSEVAVERTWRAADGGKDYRRPDVQATFRGLRVAFEVQLSTTFLSVVVGRRAFYRDQGALLVWVFGSFDPAYRRLTTDDLLFSNNSNVFVIDEETARQSISEGRFIVRCHHRKPVRRGNEIADEWVETLAPFAELRSDLANQHLCLFDFEDAERKLRKQIAQEAIDREEHRTRELRKAFTSMWCDMDGATWMEREAVWSRLRDALDDHQVIVPTYSNEDLELSAMLNALFSAQRGRSVGWEFSNLVQVGHHVHAVHPRLLLPFGYALRHYDRAGQLREEDVTGKWNHKAQSVAQRMREYDPALMPDREWLPLMSFLFPEVAAEVSGYLRRAADKRGQLD